MTIYSFTGETASNLNHPGKRRYKMIVTSQGFDNFVGDYQWFNETSFLQWKLLQKPTEDLMATSDNKTILSVYGMVPMTGSTDFLCGVEYEIESIAGIKTNLPNCNIQEDHSLRNYGKEFITTPLSFDKQLDFFKFLHSSLVFHKEFPPYSERTSTHVHVNFQTLTIDKVAQFVQLYILFEPYFFSLVDAGRKDSIYCVPLSYTYLPKHYSQNITYQINKWHKYTAFNILPLASQGTIEFRHLQGTDNYEVFKTWLTTIKNLYDFNRDNNVNFALVEGGLTQLFQTIFKTPMPFHVEQLRDSSLDVKLSTNKFNNSFLTSKIARLNKMKETV